MGTFGEFETRPGDQGKRFPGGTVTYDARRPGDPDYRYLVKLVGRRAMTVDPQTGGTAPDAKVEEQRGLFAQQREMTLPRAGAGKAATQAPHWVSVHACGTTADGAFAVFDQHVTLQRLMQARPEPIGPAELKHVIGSVVAGLQELRSFGSRAHGRLRASNIFLQSDKGKGWARFLKVGKSQGWDRRAVLLTDIAPARDASEPGDMRALGELLYLCVTGETFNQSDVAVADSEAWQRLGTSAGTAWRELCARMVHPVPSQRPSLEDARELIDPIEVPRDWSWARRAVAASLLALLVLGVGFAVWHKGNHANWKRYDRAYQRWAMVTVEELGKPRLDAAVTEPRPEEFFRFTLGHPADAAAPPEVLARNKVWRDLLEEWRGKTERLTKPGTISTVNPWSAAQIDGLLKTVTELAESIRSWPELAWLHRVERVFRDAGWTDLADVFLTAQQRVLDPLADESDAASAARPLAKLPDAAISVAEIRRRTGVKIDLLFERLTELDALDRQLSAPGVDPKLSGLAAKVKAELARYSPTAKPTADDRSAESAITYAPAFDDAVRTRALDRGLGTLNAELDKRVSQINKVAELVRKGEWYIKGEPLSAADANADTYDLLGRLLASNASVGDKSPLEDDALRARLADLKKQLNGQAIKDSIVWLERSAMAAAAPGVTAATVEARKEFAKRESELHQLEAKLSELEALKFPADVSRIRAGASALTNRLDQYNLDGLAAQVARVIDGVRKYEQANAKDDTAFRDLQVKRFDGQPEWVTTTWTLWLDKLNKSAAAKGLSGSAFRDPFDVAAERLSKFAAEPVPAPPVVPAGRAAAGFQTRFLDLLQPSWATEKAAALARHRDAGPPATVEPTADGDPVAKALVEARAAYTARADAAIALAAAAVRLQERLLRCERFTDPWPAEGGLALKDAYKELVRATDAVKDAAILKDQQLVEVTEAARRGLAVEIIDAKLASDPASLTPTDRADLVAAVTAPADPPQPGLPELRRNAWLVLRDLGKYRTPAVGVAVWPATQDELRQERAVRQQLTNDLLARAQRLGTQLLLPEEEVEAWRVGRRKELSDAGPVTLLRYVEGYAHKKSTSDVAAAVEAARDPAILSDFNLDATRFAAALSGPIKAALAFETAKKPNSFADLRRGINTLAAELSAAAGWKPAETDPYDFWTGRRDEVVALRAKYKAMADELRARLAQKDDDAAPAVVPAATPPRPAAEQPNFAAAGLGMLDWKPTFNAADGTVTYRSPAAARRDVSITFAPVPDPATPGKARAYLATTELSVEMTNALVASAAAKNKVPPAAAWANWMGLSKTDEGGMDKDRAGRPKKDGRVGPRTWQWDPMTNELTKTAGWLGGDAQTKVINHYGPGDVGGEMWLLAANAPGGNPSLRHPLHRLSPAQGVYMAAIANGRLPTVTEWQQAYKSEPAPESPWNLRDTRYIRHVNYINGLGKPLGTHWPDEGIFWPQGATKTSEGAAALPNPLAKDDGILWFCPVDEGNGPPGAPGNAPGRVFKHLVGNVAEFVSSKPIEPTAAMLRDPEETRRALRRNDSIFVIGASALSPPAYDAVSGPASPEKPFPADASMASGLADPNKNGRALWSYVDVGIRLAIDVPVTGGGDAVAAATPPPPPPPQRQTLAEWFKEWLGKASPWQTKT
jgi:hypothetical protein